MGLVNSTNGPAPNGTDGHKQNGTNGHTSNGWNGTFMKSKDPYALMRDCNANSR